MKEVNGYNISKKEFKKISKWVEDVYNITVVVDYFVSNQPELEECYNLAPVIKNLRAEADLLNAFFIDTAGEDKTNKVIQMLFKKRPKGFLLNFSRYLIENI